MAHEDNSSKKKCPSTLGLSLGLGITSGVFMILFMVMAILTKGFTRSAYK